MDLPKFGSILLLVCSIELNKAAIDAVPDAHNTLFEPQPERGLIPFDEIIKELFGDGELFNPFIDVAFLRVADGSPVFFIRESGFPKVKWKDTYDPEYLGPFRSIGPKI